MSVQHRIVNQAGIGQRTRLRDHDLRRIVVSLVSGAESPTQTPLLDLPLELHLIVLQRNRAIPDTQAPRGHQRRASGGFPVMRVVYVGGGLEGRGGPVGHPRAEVVVQCNWRALAENFADGTGGALKKSLSSPRIGRD